MFAPARTFPMSLDRPNRWITAAVGLMVAGVMASLLAVLGDGAPALAWATVCGIGGVCVLAWALGPKSVTLDGDTLHVTRRAGRPLAIPASDVASIEEGPDGRRTLVIRLFGVGGFFGTYGLLWVHGIGRLRGYVTRRGRGLLIRRRSGLPVLVTPDDPDTVVETLRGYGIPYVPPRAVR